MVVVSRVWHYLRTHFPIPIAWPCPLTLTFQELLRRQDIRQNLDTFSKAKTADVVVIMTLVNDEDDIPSRQIAVYSPNRIFRDQVSSCYHRNWLYLVAMETFEVFVSCYGFLCCFISVKHEQARNITWILAGLWEINSLVWTQFGFGALGCYIVCTQNLIQTSDPLLACLTRRDQYIGGRNQNGFKCYCIKKQIEPFLIQKLNWGMKVNKGWSAIEYKSR